MRTYRRHTVITMSSNEQDVLRDRTGSRRYWVIQCAGERADLGWLGKYRDQMLAEAFHYFQQGQEWWLDAQESAWQRKANGEFQYLDWFTQCAQTAYDGNQGGKRNRFTVGEFAAAIDRNLSAQRFGLSLAAALHSVGFVRYRSGGAKYYHKPGEPEGADTGMLAIKRLTRSDFEQKFQ